jgi:hypothetical protein
MDEKKKRGRPSVWDKRLSKTTDNTYWCSPEVYEVLKKDQTKKVLSKMTLDENYKKQVWDSAQ